MHGRIFSCHLILTLLKWASSRKPVQGMAHEATGSQPGLPNVTHAGSRMCISIRWLLRLRRPAQGVVSRPAAAAVQQQAAPQVATQSPGAAAQEAGVHSSAPAPVSSLASVGPGHSLFQHLHKVLQPSLDTELAASATRQPSMSAGSPQQTQQVPAGVSLPPSMARIAAALPPGQQQVMVSPGFLNSPLPVLLKGKFKQPDVDCRHAWQALQALGQLMAGLDAVT